MSSAVVGNVETKSGTWKTYKDSTGSTGEVLNESAMNITSATKTRNAPATGEDRLEDINGVECLELDSHTAVGSADADSMREMVCTGPSEGSQGIHNQKGIGIGLAHPAGDGADSGAEVRPSRKRHAAQTFEPQNAQPATRDTVNSATVACRRSLHMIHFIGDSNAQELGRHFANTAGVEVDLRFCYPGQASDEILRKCTRSKRSPLAVAPENMAVVWAGTNDCRLPTAANCFALAKAAHSKGARVIVIEPTKRDGPPDTILDGFADCVKRANGTHLDVRRLLDPGMFCDPLHLTDEGKGVVVDRLRALMRLSDETLM